RNAHIAGMHGDALTARAENRVNAVASLFCRATAPRHALVALAIARIVEVIAARALQEVAAHRGHIPQLLRSSRENGLREHRITGPDEFMVSRIRVACERTDANAAFMFLNTSERQAIDVHQMSRTLDAHLHQI